MGPRMPSLMDSVLEDFDDLDLEGVPEGGSSSGSLGRSRGGADGYWDRFSGRGGRDGGSGSVILNLKNDLVENSAGPPCGTNNLNVLYAFVFPVPR